MAAPRTVARLTVAVHPAAACSPPGGTQPATGLHASVLAEKAATWPETGLGLLYSDVNGAHICWSRSANYYIAVHADNIAGARAMNLGDIVLTPGFDVPKEHLTTLARHEARHRAQWAVGTVIGGPFAFPLAYAVDDFFFPRSRNHFERQAGLESGGYQHGPILGPLQVIALVLLVALAAAVVVARRRGPASARPRARTPASRR